MLAVEFGCRVWLQRPQASTRISAMSASIVPNQLGDRATQHRKPTRGQTNPTPETNPGTDPPRPIKRKPTGDRPTTSDQRNPTGGRETNTGNRPATSDQGSQHGDRPTQPRGQRSQHRGQTRHFRSSGTNRGQSTMKRPSEEGDRVKKGTVQRMSCLAEWGFVAVEDEIGR